MAVQKAYERLQMGAQGGQGPQPWRLLLLLKVRLTAFLNTCDLQPGIPNLTERMFAKVKLSCMPTIKSAYRDIVYAQIPHCCLSSMRAEKPS